MMIQFACKACLHECTEEESQSAKDGFCQSCVAYGKHITPVEEVRRWRARDGSLHENLEAALYNNLFTELRKAISVHNRNHQDADNSARHILSHFIIARRGEKTPVPLPSEILKDAETFSWRRWGSWHFWISSALAIGVLMGYLIGASTK